MRHPLHYFRWKENASQTRRFTVIIIVPPETAAPHDISPAPAPSMKIKLVKITITCAFALVFSAAAFGQSNGASARSSGSIGSAMLHGTGKVAVVIIKSAGKAAWETTKFTAKDIAKPLLLKAAPKVAMFALKLTGTTMKNGIPVVSKLGFAYLKAKLPF